MGGGEVGGGDVGGGCGACFRSAEDVMVSQVEMESLEGMSAALIINVSRRWRCNSVWKAEVESVTATLVAGGGVTRLRWG